MYIYHQFRLSIYEYTYAPLLSSHKTTSVIFPIPDNNTRTPHYARL